MNLCAAAKHATANLRPGIPLDKWTTEFIDEVADWLLATRDTRLSFSHSGAQMFEVFLCCADFCRFLEKLEVSGIHAEEWRNHLNLL